ncbi:MAG: PAS domain S-box protein, partial [Anaerolineales bacterium]|nr:PAS domain S-box protein [Anaerolineales bacterium]
SDSVQRMYGITPQDGMENSDLIYGRVHKEDRLRVWQEEEQANQTLSVFKTEVRIMNPDGSIRWSSLISTPRRLEDGSTYWDGIELDITERKQMETALRESETRFSSAFHASPVAQTITALESGLVLDVNEAFSDLMGYTYDELIGRTTQVLWMDFNDRQKIAKQLSLDGAIHDMEMPLLSRSGQHRIVLVSMAMIELKGEKCIISTLLDITERKKIEQELHIKDRALATSVNAVIITALDGKAIFANDVLSSMFGYSREETLQLNAIDLAYDSVEAHQVFNSLYSQGFFMSESIAKRKDGSCFPIQISASLITDLNGQPIAMMASFIDISERRRAEKKLRGVEEFQRILLNATESTAISLFDCAGTLLSINELGAQRIGKRPNELVGLSIHDIFPKEIADRRKERIDEACRTAAPVSFEDSRQSFQYETTVYPILDATGKATRVAAYARDITERKRNERLLRESEQRYYVLAEASHDMIFVIDRDDKITYVNHYAAMQLGVQPDALIGQARSRWFGQFDSEKMGKSLKQVIETGKSQYEEVEIDFPHGTAYLSTWLVPLKDQSGAIDSVMGVSRDISKLKKMEYLLKKTNLELESKVENRTAELRDSRDRLRELSQKIITTQEEERRRVSRELHDDAGQALIGLRFSLDSVYKELPANLRKLRQRMAKALTQTDQTIQRIRTLAYNLRPPTLDLVGINLGIKELCREFSDQTGLKVEYSGVDLEGLHDEISISLYRFVQETLTNVVKHAGASKVQVTLEYQDEMIKVSVQDNGQGISVGKENAGLGMVGIKERFDTLGGALEVKPVTPKGTLIQVCLPWKDIVKM